MHVPKYRRNPDGRAFVEYKKRRTYLGQFGTASSKKAYRDFVAGLVGDPQAAPTQSVTGLTVAEAAADYMLQAERYYAGSGEFNNVRVAVDDFVKLFASDELRELSPRHLLEFQRQLVAAQYARTSINSRVSRVKRWLRWCASRELIPVGIYEGVRSVDGLRTGRSAATESEPVQPVKLADVEKTLRHVAPVVAAMARVQYLCGMRPSEVCRMRACDIDQSGPVWFYRPAKHKTAWRGVLLVKAIPAPAQKLLAPFLANDPDAWLFTPRMSRDFWKKSVPRKSKVWAYELRQRKRQKPSDRPYTSATYGKAIKYGIERARRAGEAVAYWQPNQLRHAIAAELSRTLGQQAAQRWLGHSRLETTAIYAGLNAEELAQIAAAVDRLASPAAEEPQPQNHGRRRKSSPPPPS